MLSKHLYYSQCVCRVYICMCYYVNKTQTMTGVCEHLCITLSQNEQMLILLYTKSPDVVYQI